ncbi:PREDICTED: fasciclin-like arabinogalactan protein 2 [Fragaria vesca subsp. vesca]|uniref:fasciclin-like arabinogalactan protein 2 n=1 Tax=Fragaria vesca subsp. vesca TaxID=101020 RepID=UPI0002C37557|nr:PREDICTED: fasciclin-like arabinogalactan protein 2 [Fragaria vesca subsp. vesca]
MAPPPPLTSTLALSLSAILLLLFTSTSQAHNITRILAKHPSLSTFNHYLTLTHLAAEINRRQTITVLAIDNAAMDAILAKHFSIPTLKNVLSLHVLVDYFGAKKLHQLTGGTTLTATMFQSTGTADGTSGYVNITNLKGGKVGFGTEDNDGKLNSFYEKSVQEIPYNISVLQISQVLTSAEAEAPTAGPSDVNLTSILAKQGCKAFSDLLISTGADTTFQNNVDGGLTVFCPTDAVVSAFAPKFKNLTAPQKLALVLYHGIPVYQSLQMLKSNNGVINTLATDKANKYDFTVQNDGEEVSLETKVVTAKITGTVLDQDPLVIYKVNKVLQPKELFKVVKTKAAPSPKKAAAPSEDDADAPSEDDADAPSEDDSADATADDNGVSGLMKGGNLVVVGLSLCVGVLLI